MSSITVDPSSSTPERLSFESILTVDLRLLSQPELLALSRSSSNAFDLRRCDDVVIPKIDRSVFNESAGSRKQTYSRLRLAPRKPDVSSLKTRPAAPEPLILDDPERAENARIISLFKHLFNSGSHVGELVPSYGQCREVVPAVSNLALRNLADCGDEMVVKKKRGRNPKHEKLASFAQPSSSHPAAVPLARESDINALVVCENEEDIEKQIVNKNGVAVDLIELAKAEDPYGAEIRRRTEGLGKDEDLLGFLRNLSGQWGSRRKKRKIIDANEFGDALPRGWKVLIGMKKKQGNAWLFCRRYISPNGRHFISCKEVSSYLLSLNGFQDTKQLNSMQCPEATENDGAAGNADDTSNFGNAPSSHVSHVSDQEKPPIMTNKSDTGKERMAGDFKCHKCSTPFNEKDGLLHHLISCHKRKRRKSGMPIDDDCLAIIDGRYECQFCQKTFHERTSYFGHVGIHVKTYMRSIGGSPCIATTQSDEGVACMADGRPTASEPQESMHVDSESVAGTPITIASNERHPQLDAALSHSDITYRVDKSVLNKLSPDFVRNVKADGSDKDLSEDSSDIGNETCGMSDNELRKVDEGPDISAGRLNDCFTYKVKQDAGSARSCKVPVETCQVGQHNNDIEEYVVRPSGNPEFCSVVAVGQGGLKNSDHELPCDLVTDPCKSGVTGSDVLPGHKVQSPTKNDYKKDEKFNKGEKMVQRNTIELMLGSRCDRGDSDGDVDDNLQHNYLESSSAVPHQDEDETYGIGENANGAVESTSPGSKVQEGSDLGLLAPVSDMHTYAIYNYVGRASDGFKNDASSEICRVRKNDLSIDTDSHGRLEELSDSGACQQTENKESNFVGTLGNVVSGGKEKGLSKGGPLEIGSFSSCMSQFEQGVSIGNNADRVISSKTKEPRAGEITDPNSQSFASGSSDSPLNATFLVGKVREKTTACFLPLSSGNSHSLASESNLFTSCDTYGPSKLDVYSGRDLSSPSPSVEFSSALTDQVHDAHGYSNKSSAAAGEVQFAEQHKLDGSRTKSVIGFYSNIGSLNVDVPPSVRQKKETVSEGSHFSLWNDPSYTLDDDQKRDFDGTRVNSRQERLSQSSTLAHDGFGQACDVGYNLNEAYVGAVQGLPRVGQPNGSTELMIGYSNHEQHTQNVGTDALWRSNGGNILPSGLGDPSSQGQLSGSFRAFDFLSDKGANDMYTIDDKLDNISSFDGLRPATVEPMEFSFLAPQDSNPQLQNTKVLPYGNAGMIPGFDSSIWFDKDSSLPIPGMGTGPVVHTMCVWCGNEFQQEPTGFESQAGSIGSLCPSCKCKIPGQLV